MSPEAPLHDWEDPDPADQDDDIDETATITCASCDREVHEDAEWCPYCGEPVIAKESQRSMLMIVMIAVAIAATLVIMLR